MIKINAILNYRNNLLNVFNLLKHQDTIKNLEILCVKDLNKTVIGHENIKSVRHDPADIYLFKASKRNTRKSCEICSKLTINKQEQGELLLFIIGNKIDIF